MRLPAAALAVLSLFGSGCAAIGLRPSLAGGYATALPPFGGMGSISFLTLNRDGTYAAFYHLTYLGRMVMDDTLGPRTMQQRSTGTWVWSPPRLLLHRQGTPEEVSFAQWLGNKPPVVSSDAVLTATFRDGHWTIAWGKTEYQSVTNQAEYSMDLRSLYFPSR